MKGKKKNLYKIANVTYTTDYNIGDKIYTALYFIKI